MTERVTVHAGGGSYDVVIGGGVLMRTGALIPELPGAERAFVVSDQRVAGEYLDKLAYGLSLPLVHLTVPEGEEGKTLGTVEVLYQQLVMQEAHRDDPIIALGGGATGDVAGFVAATYMRGVPYIQVPTTLTAQVDAAIGGKTAINLPKGKNLVGAFYQPRVVLADIMTLGTLPDGAFSSGLAEVVKYGLAVDPAILDVLESSRSAIFAREVTVLVDLIARCVRAKAAIVEEDERDTGRRAVLNYGHTLGHALERLEGFGGLTHGEAISVGMLFAAKLAEIKGVAAPGLLRRHLGVLAGLGLLWGGTLDPEAVLEAFRLDKKYRGGVRFVLLEDIGRARLVDDVSEAEIREALEAVR